MATHSSILAQRIRGQRNLVGCCPQGLIELDMTEATQHACMCWRRKWQPTPVFLPRESQGRWSLVGYCLWGRIESDMTEATQQQHGSSIFSFFEELLYHSPKWLYQFTFPSTVQESLFFSTLSPIFIVCRLLMLAFLTGMRQILYSFMTHKFIKEYPGL